MHRLFCLGMTFALVCWSASTIQADSVVVFNEVMYHPLGDEAALEWVELHNQMAVDVDISGWYFGDGIRYDFAQGTIVPGGGFVVVATSPSALQAATGFAAALGPASGRLDNSGEKLELRNPSHRIMDTLSYKDSGAWPAGPDGSGFTLAKRDPDLGTGRSTSWTTSAERGGTPGTQNFPVAGAPDGFPDDVISYWSLDQTSGSMTDLAGGNNGTLGSGATRVPGIVGAGAASFNNTSSAFISVGSGSVGTSYAATQGITVEAIIRPTWSAALNDHDQIFRKEDGDRRILLALQNDGNNNGFSNPPVAAGPVLSFGINVGGTYSELDMLLDGQAGRPTLATLLDGNPHHVAATYDAASGIKAIHVDGVLAFSVNLGAGQLVSSGGSTTAYLGNMSGRGEPYSGVLDEVAIWKRGLTATEVARHAQNSREGKTYFEEDPITGGEKPPVALNEVFAPLVGDGWVEVINHGTTPLDLQGLVVAAASAGGNYVFPTLVLAGGTRAQVTRAQLGFALTPDDTLFLFGANRATLLDSFHLEEGLRGRTPEATGRWLVPGQATPGTANIFNLNNAIVINEIQYHARAKLVGANLQKSNQSWIELHNKSGAAVDISGWRLAEGIDFVLPASTLLGAGEYLVVANDRASLALLHPGVRILGDFVGSLSRSGERIELLDASGNLADEVRYADSGRWPGYADGGGSTLELRDPDADNSRAEAWAASDESVRSSWQSYSYVMTAAANVGPTQWNELVVGLLDAGEALIDNIYVIETPDTTPKDLLQNSTFDTGADKWRLIGNHRHSLVIDDPDDPTNKVLHLVATGATEHMHNHLETTYANAARITNGRKYEVSFDARWLAGSNQLNTRLYFNRCPRTTLLDVPAASGTPGARNSRHEANIGPTYDSFRHHPIVPAANDPTFVEATPRDPDGVTACALWYAVNGGAWASVAMTAGTGGVYTGQVPGQAAAALVQFYVEATDGLGAKSAFPAAGRDSRALYRVEDNLANLGRVHNLRILMTRTDTDFLHLETNVMSNDRMGCTLVYNERQAFYDVGVRLKGSERGRNVSGRVGFNLRLDPEDRFRGVHLSIQVDRSGGWKFGGPFGQDEIVVKHVASHAGDLPAMHDDLIRVIAPRSAQTGPAMLIMAAYANVFLESQYPNGGDGNAFELELIYHPTSTVDGRPESLKRPEPDNVLGTDFTNLGNDKEVYRWTFLKENNRLLDDYSGLINLCKAMATTGAGAPAATEAIMDLDQWMRAFAVYSLCGINDAYTRGNNHNLIVYQRPTDGRFEAFPWDMDFSWVQATNSALWGDQNLGRITQLIPNRRLYYCHLLDIINTTYNTTYMAHWTSHYGSLASQDYSSILTYIGQRRSFVLSQIPAKVPFAITTNNGLDFTVDTTSTTLEGNAWYDVKFVLLEGQPEPLALTWPTISKWRTSVPLNAGPNVLQVYGFDRLGNLLASDEITISSSVGTPAPTLTSVTPGAGKPGDTVELRGTNFQAGFQVLFGTTPATEVTWNAAVDPGLATVTVPVVADGLLRITLRNPDGRTSNALDFTAQSTTLFVRGDVDLSGSVDLADIVRLLFYLYLGVSIDCEDAADITNNEVLDVADAINGLNFLFRGGPAPAAPFPQPGTDAGAAGVLACGLGV